MKQMLPYCQCALHQVPYGTAGDLQSGYLRMQ